MGQYYHPTNLDKEEWLSPYEYNGGAKLMETSWLLNGFVQTVESLLTPDGPWHKNRIVWAGDYADNEQCYKCPHTLEDDDEDNDGNNLYCLIGIDENKISPDEVNLATKFRFIVNHSKKVYVDKRDLNKVDDDWIIHPLPLFTCEGNGRGGGDFRNDDERVGTWARDIISIEAIEPDSDYTKIDGNFSEE